MNTTRLPRRGLLALIPFTILALALATWWSPTTAPQIAHAASEVTLCGAHGVDASLCMICDPSLRDPGRLWCREHGRYEDRCWLCHPELRDPDRLYCEEHGLYEDECAICRPGAVASEASATTELHCGEHDLKEAECGICHPELADGLPPGGSLKIRLPSVDSARYSGVQSDVPAPVRTALSVQAIGEVGYDLNRLARVTPLVEGVVRAVHVDLGDRVVEGQPLVTLASPRIAEAGAELIGAIAAEEAAERTLERERELFDRGVSAERDLVEAQAQSKAVAARRAALEQNLRDLGVDASAVAAIARGERSASTLDLVAPFDGTVVARSVVLGDVASPGAELVRVADVDEMWVSISIPEHELEGVAVGQSVDIRSSATGARAEGVVTWVSSHLDEATRMARVRAAIPNRDGRWKAGMFVDARVDVGGGAVPTLAVPAGAVHRFGGHPFVFVDRGEGLYEVRRVDLARQAVGDPRFAAHAFVTSGLDVDDRVVTAQSFLVKSEFQKSRLGAGCVD